MTRSEVRVPHRPPYIALRSLRNYGILATSGDRQVSCTHSVVRKTTVHHSTFGAIAQLARAPALQAGGPGFESLLLHHFKLQRL